MAKKLFESLRSIADEGKIVIVITHTPDRVIDLFDDVIVLAKDSGRTGRLAFYGSIDESYEFFSIPDILKDVTDMMISKWGTQGLCALARYNDLPAVLIWNRMVAAGNVDLGGIMKLSDVMRMIEENGLKDSVLSEPGKATQNAAYVSTAENLISCWGHLAAFSLVFAFLTIVFMEFIDRDRR